MNPNLILQAAQQPDIVGAMDRGTMAAQRMGGVMRENALANLYRTQGPGIMQGDPNALASLAQFDPNAALGVQSARLGIEGQQLSLTQAREAGARAAREEAARIGSARAQEEAANGMRFLRIAQAALTTGDMQSYNMAVAELGMPGVDPGQFPVLAAGIEGGIEAIVGTRDALKPPAPNPADRFRVVGNQLVDLAAEGGPRTVLTDAGQMEIIYGQDGQPIVQRGPANSARFTEQQSKDNVYAVRAEGALSLLDSVGAEALTDRVDRGLEVLPFGLGRELQNENFQVADQAGAEFLQAILRKDTGAAITEGEQSLYGETYLPRPGDGPRVLEAKRASRIRALEALRAGMNIQQVTVTERALVDAARRAAESRPEGAPDPASGAGSQQTGQAAMPQVSDDASYNALPSGTEFMAPDGSVRRKP